MEIPVKVENKEFSMMIRRTNSFRELFFLSCKKATVFL
jgi:hypothetical protein